MELAIEYLDLREKFEGILDDSFPGSNASTITGRKFDRIIVDGHTKYFIEKNTRGIYGAKSDLQYNPRRYYGTLNDIDEYDWLRNHAKDGTALQKTLNDMETTIQAGYKKRGRPRKSIT